jgi:hypothetical protein
MRLGLGVELTKRLQSDSPAPFSEALVWGDAEDIAGVHDQTLGGWADHSPNGNDLTSVGGTPLLQLNAINGLKAVRGRGASDADAMTFPNGVLTGVTEATAIYVGKLLGTAGLNGGALFGAFGTDALDNHFPLADSNIYEDFCSTVRKTAAGPWIPTMSAYHIGVLRSKANLFNIRLAEASIFNTATNTVGVNTGTTHLFRGPNNWWHGEVAWFIVIPRYLTDPETVEAEAWLKERFAL